MTCDRCEGRGWYWTTPRGFNPFSAGGWSTMKAMYRETCSCARDAALASMGEPDDSLMLGGCGGVNDGEDPNWY